MMSLVKNCAMPALLGGATCLALSSALLVPFVVAPAPDGDLALVIAPPWVDIDTVIAGSGGGLVGPVQAPFATLARFETDVPVHRLKGHGAWAVLDGRRIALICGVENNV